MHTLNPPSPRQRLTPRSARALARDAPLKFITMLGERSARVQLCKARSRAKGSEPIGLFLVAYHGTRAHQSARRGQRRALIFSVGAAAESGGAIGPRGRARRPDKFVKAARNRYVCTAGYRAAISIAETSMRRGHLSSADSIGSADEWRPH